MCNHCSSPTFGQDQPEARKADKEKLDKVRRARENKSQRRENAELN